jgi:hypothetical protein
MGSFAEVFELTGLESWDTSNIKNMSGMFSGTAPDVDYLLDLSGWNVQNVTDYNRFNDMVETKVLAPTWSN